MSVSEIISKVARFAVSKAAGFSYAVAVGVAANLAFHFVQPREPAPVTTTAPQAARPTNDGAVAGPADTAAIPPVPALPAAPPNSTPLATPAARAKPPVPTKTVAPGPVLPEPPTETSLPRAAALPAPVFKPVALPGEAPLYPTPASSAGAVPPAPSPASRQAVGLSPLGPAIDVSTPPMPPVQSPTPPTPPAGAVKAATAEAPPSGLELSDVWHPGRAVEKGLHWAGKQVPLIGEADGEPHSKVAAPIPLLPSATKPASLESSDAAPSPPRLTAPGPGSGGLY
jgi:hypothetical protein